MRLGLFLGLVIVALAGFGLVSRFHSYRTWRRALARSEVTVAKARKDAAREKKDPSALDRVNPPAPENGDKDSWTVSVTGEGRDNKEAKENALDTAAEKVAKYMHTEDLDLDWMRDHVSKYLVAEEKAETPKEVERNVLFPDGLVARYTIRVQIAPAAQAELLRQARETRIEQRLPLALKVLGGLLAVLLASAGYVYLDEWSKGYYTSWLRLAAIGIVAAVVVLGLLALLPVSSDVVAHGAP